MLLTYQDLRRLRQIQVVCLTMLAISFFGCGSHHRSIRHKAPFEEKLRLDVLSQIELQAVLEFMSSDLFEGRAPGTRGGQLAAAYIRSLYKLWNLAPPANAPDYYQPFEMRGFVTSDVNVRMQADKLRVPQDVVGTYLGPKKEFHIDGEAVFVGFGITSPQFAWDDYKDSDIRGKIVITRVNDPGQFDPSLFEGKTLTHFGRWTYHVDEAKRRGAKAILLIHTDESAGYSWNVVKNSGSDETLVLAEEASSPLEFSGWIREQSLRLALTKNGLDLEQLYTKSRSREFRPQSLGLEIRISGRSRSRTIVTNNVIATIRGVEDKQIVFSAHIDHLGQNRSLQPDGIFNGAIDNVSAVTAMMMVAKLIKQTGLVPRYTLTFLACHAEESGLLGSRYYVKHVDPNTVVANINFESTPVWQRAHSIMAIGARFSNLEPVIRETAAQLGYGYSQFSMVNQGFFYRSDQFSFAQKGIVAVWLSAGEDDLSGRARYQNFWQTDYHTPQDEYDPGWSLDGLRQTIQMALALTEKINNYPHAIRYKDGLPFSIE